MQTLWKQGGDGWKRIRQVRRIQQTEQIRAHRKKSDIAQVQQTGVTHHDIQAHSQQHIQQGRVENADP